MKTKNLEFKHGPDVTSKAATIPLVIKQITEDGEFEGYGSTFGNVDRGMDMVMPGAFRRTLKEKKLPAIKMLRDHDTRKLVGKWLEIREDDRGLFCKGRIFARDEDHNPLAKETLALLREGALDSLSMGYRTVKATYDEENGIRQLLEVDLWEVSVVTFPMNEMATVDAVKADDLTINDVERILREGGAPGQFAKMVAIHGYGEAIKRISSHREGGSVGKSLAEEIRATTALLKG